MDSDADRTSDEQPLVFPAYLMRTGPLAIWTTRGQMRVGDGRISFETRRGSVFDGAISELRNVSFPRYNRGAVVKLQLGSRRYRIALELPRLSAQPNPGGLALRSTGQHPSSLAYSDELKRRLGVSG
jgi:hypothetical protein